MSTIAYILFLGVDSIINQVIISGNQQQSEQTLKGENKAPYGWRDGYGNWQIDLDNGDGG